MWLAVDDISTAQFPDNRFGEGEIAHPGGLTASVDVTMRNAGFFR